MTQSTRSLLRRALAKRYDKLRQRLAQRLGSDSLAGDVLHETWIRLGRGGDLGPISNHEAYVYRAAINTATNMRIADERKPHALDLMEALDVIDEAPDPQRIADSRDQIQQVIEAVAELSERQRDVFHLCFMQGIGSEEIAKRHGVSLRTVQADLRTVVVHCARRVGRKDILADRTFRVSRD